MRVRATIRGDLADVMRDEIAEASRDFRDGVSRAGRALQADLRAQTKQALPRGPGIANAWRERTYPLSPIVVTLHPTAMVWTRAPNIISAFDEGKPITAKRGKYLCWPTGYNATRGRRNAGARGGLRVTPEEMAAAKGDAVIVPAKRDPSLKLWCLRVREARGTSRRSRNRVRLFVGRRNVEVLTGRMKAGDRATKAGALLKSGLVPMFFLRRSVNPGKRLDVDGAMRRAEATLPGFVAGGRG